jgi:hypothetical protein
MHLRAHQILSRSSVAQCSTLNALATPRVLILSLVLVQKVQNIQIGSRGEEEASGANVIMCQEN